MILKFFNQTLLLLAFTISFCESLHAQAINLVVNGNFETGDLTGWTADEQNPHGPADGFWTVYSGNSTLLPPPPEGTYAAYSDTRLFCSLILYQDITLPGPSTLQYTYYYEQNPTIEFVTQPTLSVSTSPNQQARIDIMNPSSSPFSVDPSDVWLNLFQTEPGDPTSLSPTTVSFDLSSFAGETIRLRYAVTATQGYLYLAVDAVSILLEVTPPVNLTGSVLKNRFLTQKDRINHLQWQPSLTTGIAAYYVFRNGKLIAKIPSTAPLMYNDHNRGKKPDVYSVTAVTADGIESNPVTITLP